MPLRHFESKAALLSAVAEIGMHDFVAAVAREVEAAAPERQLPAMGVGYLRWAIGNPAQFIVVSDRSIFNLTRAPALLAQSEAVMEQLDRRLIARYGSRPDFMLAPGRLVFRAQVYGLARMAVDRHLEEWSVPPRETLDYCLSILDQFFALLPDVKPKPRRAKR